MNKKFTSILELYENTRLFLLQTHVARRCERLRESRLRCLNLSEHRERTAPANLKYAEDEKTGETKSTISRRGNEGL